MRAPPHPLWVALAIAVALALGLWLAPAHADCPAWAGREVSAEVCDAVDQCVARAAAAGDPQIEATDPARRALLLALSRVARCAWAAQTASVANARARALLSPVPRCPEPVVCEPCATVERPLWVDAASHAGACAVCGAVVAAGAVAACGGTP